MIFNQIDISDSDSGEDTPSVSYLTSTISSTEQDASTSHRKKEIELALEYAAEYFPFGAGANRILLGTKINIIESFYGFHLIKWGCFGLFLFMLI